MAQQVEDKLLQELQTKASCYDYLQNELLLHGEDLDLLRSDKGDKVLIGSAARYYGVGSTLAEALSMYEKHKLKMIKLSKEMKDANISA